MPRLDNSCMEVIEVYNLEFDENDAGRTEPVDLCLSCHCDWTSSSDNGERLDRGKEKDDCDRDSQRIARTTG